MLSSKTDSYSLSAFINDFNDVTVIKEVVSALKITQSDVIEGGVKEAIQAFSKGKSPQFLIVDISKSELPISDLNKLLEACEPGVGIIAIGKENDVALYRDLMKLGIFEYLVSPLFPEIVSRALKSMIFGEGKGKESHSKVGKIIVGVGSRGGVGTTFVLSNFAAMLAHERSRRIVIVDLDFHYGTVSLYFNLSSSYGFREALETPERIDDVFLERLLIPINERFFILSSEDRLNEVFKLKVEGIETLLRYLAKSFHYVIIDVPHYCNEITNSVIDNAHIALLISTPSLAGVRDTRRLLQLFGEEEVGRRPIVILNKFGELGKNEIQISEFEESVKHKINHFIPYDPLISAACINEGKTLVSAENALSAAIREISNDVVGISTPEKKHGAFESFLKSIKLK